MDPHVRPGRQESPGPLTRYLVELVDTADGLTAIQSISARARRAAAEVAGGGQGVRFLRVVFVPEDGSCFLLYEAESEHAIRRAVTVAGIDTRSVAGTLKCTGDQRPERPSSDDGVDA